MSKADDDFMAAFDKYLDAVGPDAAIPTATTIFVSLLVSLAKHRGCDVNLPITIDGGKNRDITIHAPKDALKKEGK